MGEEISFSLMHGEQTFFKSFNGKETFGNILDKVCSQLEINRCRHSLYLDDLECDNELMIRDSNMCGEPILKI